MDVHQEPLLVQKVGESQGSKQLLRKGPVIEILLLAKK